MIQEPIERAPNSQSRNSLSGKVNKIVLAYKPKYKINIYNDINK